jgi:hypothetical protein
MRSFAVIILLGLPLFVSAQASGDSQAPQAKISPLPAYSSQLPVQRLSPTKMSRSGMSRNGKKVPVVPPTAGVVTLDGVCASPKPDTPCRTVVTRADLERYMNTSSAETNARGRAALQYARTIALSSLAEKSGIAKNPGVAKELDLQLQMLRSRILATAFVESIQSRLPPVSQADIQNYYDKHQDLYEQAQIVRIGIPFSVPTESGRALDSTAIRSEMEKLHQSALAGEDFDELQKQAFQDLHIQATPAPAGPVRLRRNGLQGNEARVFDLKPGEISEILDLPAASAIYKLQSIESKPLASVSKEIETVLRRERLESELAKAGKNIGVQFNSEYLDLPSPPELFASGSSAVSPVPHLPK